MRAPHRISSVSVLALLSAVSAFAACSSEASAIEITTPRVVEASCGQCKFGLAGDRAGGCDLAVRIDGRSYYVRGTTIDEHGDSHATDGFCNAIRQARVTGRVEDGEFAVASFALVAE
jgi:hypothetical protein